VCGLDARAPDARDAGKNRSPSPVSGRRGAAAAPHNENAVKRILLVLLAGVTVFFLGRAAIRAMASDETRIGWLLAEEAAAFGGASLLNLLPHFAEDYRDAAGIGQAKLRGAVVWAWHHERDADGRFRWRVALPVGSGLVAVDGDVATAEFPLRLLEGGGDDARVVWELRVRARLQRREGEWWIVGSSHETVAGKAPGPSPR
jgi:hypothetical protein